MAMSCSRHAMITFSSSPCSRASVALCSMWLVPVLLSRSAKKSFSAGRSGIAGSAGLSPIMTSASGPRACVIKAPWQPLSPVPIVATAGGTMTRRLRSTASSSGSRIQFASPASRTEAGSSAGGTWAEGGGAVAGSGMRPRPSGCACRPARTDRSRAAGHDALFLPTLSIKCRSAHGARPGIPPAARRTVRGTKARARRRRPRMTLKILPHGRLQEWVAEERGYFAAEGLEYTFLPEGDYGVHATRRDDGGEVKTGAFETFGAGRDGADVSCACHWATNVAASGGVRQLVTSAYSVAP